MKILDSIDYYNQYANEYFESTVNLELGEVIDGFIEYLPDEAAIMDLGCGSGRDSLYFMEKGFDVTAVEGSEELSELASIHIGQDVLTMKFDELNFVHVFDGVWANASLHHLTTEEFKETLKKIGKCLKIEGILYMSFKYGEFEGIHDGRYFKHYRTKEMKEIIQAFDIFEVMKVIKTEDVRPGREEDIWLNVIVKKIKE